MFLNKRERKEKLNEKFFTLGSVIWFQLAPVFEYNFYEVMVSEL